MDTNMTKVTIERDGHTYGRIYGDATPDRVIVEAVRRLLNEIGNRAKRER